MTQERTDWVAWHESYARPGSSMPARLVVVQGYLQDWLAQAPQSARALSLCSGDGRDVIEVLSRADEGPAVSVTLVELDETLAARARTSAEECGLDAVVEVRCADAADPVVWSDAVPADLVLLAGIFGNVPDTDIRRTVEALPMMCAPGAWVVWTRHRHAPDLTPRVRDWFAAAGFEQVGFTGSEIFGVGAHRYVGETAAWDPPTSLFTFFR